MGGGTRQRRRKRAKNLQQSQQSQQDPTVTVVQSTSTWPLAQDDSSPRPTQSSVQRSSGTTDQPSRPTSAPQSDEGSVPTTSQGNLSSSRQSSSRPISAPQSQQASVPTTSRRSLDIISGERKKFVAGVGFVSPERHVGPEDIDQESVWPSLEPSPRKRGKKNRQRATMDPPRSPVRSPRADAQSSVPEASDEEFDVVTIVDRRVAQAIIEEANAAAGSQQTERRQLQSDDAPNRGQRKKRSKTPEQPQAQDELEPSTSKPAMKMSSKKTQEKKKKQRKKKNQGEPRPGSSGDADVFPTPVGSPPKRKTRKKDVSPGPRVSVIHIGTGSGTDDSDRFRFLQRVIKIYTDTDDEVEEILINEPQPGISRDEQPQPGISADDEPQPGISGDEQPQPGLSRDDQPQPGISADDEPQPGISGDEPQSQPEISGDDQPQPGISGDDQPQPGCSHDDEPQPGCSYSDNSPPSSPEYMNTRVGRHSPRVKPNKEMKMATRRPFKSEGEESSSSGDSVLDVHTRALLSLPQGRMDDRPDLVELYRHLFDDIDDRYDRPAQRYYTRAFVFNDSEDEDEEELPESDRALSLREQLEFQNYVQQNINRIIVENPNAIGERPGSPDVRANMSSIIGTFSPIVCASRKMDYPDRSPPVCRRRRLIRRIRPPRHNPPRLFQPPRIIIRCDPLGFLSPERLVRPLERLELEIQRDADPSMYWDQPTWVTTQMNQHARLREIETRRRGFESGMSMSNLNRNFWWGSTIITARECRRPPWRILSDPEVDILSGRMRMIPLEDIIRARNAHDPETDTLHEVIEDARDNERFMNRVHGDDDDNDLPRPEDGDKETDDKPDDGDNKETDDKPAEGDKETDDKPDDGDKETDDKPDDGDKETDDKPDDSDKEIDENSEEDDRDKTTYL